MINDFALVVSHGLIMLAAWRLLRRPDLDDDRADSDAVPSGFLRPKQDVPDA